MRAPSDKNQVQVIARAAHILRALEGEAHLQSATSDSLRLAEAVTEHSELVAEAAHARMAGEQQRDLPGAFPGSSSVGPQW